MRKKLIAAMLVFSFVATAAASAFAADSALAQAVKKMTRGSKWTLINEVELRFPTGHPQGLVKIGDDFYVSTVEILTPTKSYGGELRDGYDRDAGDGRGFIYKFSKEGKLLATVELGEGSTYHPGGIDYDGTYIWVPVAEYRPNSASLVYKKAAKSSPTSSRTMTSRACTSTKSNPEVFQLLLRKYAVRYTGLCVTFA